MGGWFSTEGPFFQTLDKIGRLILLDLVWLFCCLPVITIVPATTAFYYAVIKSIRRGRGYVMQEFFKSFRSNLGRGILLEIPIMLVGALLIFNYNLTAASEANEKNAVMIAVYYGMMILGIGFIAYLIPVLSRFSVSPMRIVKMAFGMEFRHLPTTVLMIVGTVVSVTMMASALLATDPEEGVAPLLATWALLPGAWCYVTTFLMEPVLRKYMPPPEEDNKEWYYE